MFQLINHLFNLEQVPEVISHTSQRLVNLVVAEGEVLRLGVVEDLKNAQNMLLNVAVAAVLIFVSVVSLMAGILVLVVTMLPGKIAAIIVLLLALISGAIALYFIASAARHKSRLGTSLKVLDQAIKGI